LLTGPLQPTNEWYAIAKIAWLKMCQAYRQQYGFNVICAMPTNLYGPGDNVDPNNSHVVPALIGHFHEAKLANAPEVIIWGSGRPLRELLHVDDLVDSLLVLMRNYAGGDMVNAGSGQESSYTDLAHIPSSIIGFQGKLKFDRSKPDSTPRKLLDTTKLENSGWSARIGLNKGMTDAYRWFTTHKANSGV